MTSLLLASATLVGAAPAAQAVAHTMTPAVGAHPKVTLAGAMTARPGAEPRFACQDVRPARALCYSPAQIRRAYDIQALHDAGITGKGRRIVIVDAFSNPYIQQDLDIFDKTFGLPAATVQIVAPDGLTPFDFNDANQVGWSGEISLDVQWAHVVAPDAQLVLALAKSNDDADIVSATKYAVDHRLGDVISMSFGEGEVCMVPRIAAAQHRLFQRATQKHITLVAASGDQGAAQPNCDGSDGYFKSASTPASDPLVLGVGGTTLNADTTTGAYISERAWADDFSDPCPPPDLGCSGGGNSGVFARPPYQDGVVNSQRRGVPDVAYNAGVDGGVLTHWGVGLQVLAGLDPLTPAFFIFGGTSAGAPQWSGLVALANQLAHHQVGFVNPTIYAVARSARVAALLFHDITVGNNNFDSVRGFNARRGWDRVTGFGTPIAARIVALLALGRHG
jgi:subtilase family serine protease